MTEPLPAGGLDERRLLALALRAMLAVAVLAALVVLWRFAWGPPRQDAAPSLRVARLPPASFLWAEAPTDVRYLPAGIRPTEAARLRLLVPRDQQGRVRAFYLPADSDGRATVPAGPHWASPGLACADFAPDFSTHDIACRQTAPGFPFAARHRWSLDGRNLTGAAADLQPAPGREVNGDFVLAPVQRPDLQ